MRAFSTILPLLLLSLSPLAGQAEPASRPSPSSPTASAPTVKLLAMQERRAESFASLTLVLEVADVTNDEVRAQRVLLKSALDDAGTNLLPENAAPAAFELNYRADAEDEGKPEPATFQVRLKSPPRTAKSLKEVSGEAELFVPARDPASSVTVPGFASLDGKPISAAGLSANGIEVTVVGEKAFAAAKKAAGEAAKKKALADGDSAEDAAESASDAEKDFLSNYQARYQTLLKVKDPERRVLSYAYVDAKGTETPVRSMLIDGYTFLTHGQEAPGRDAGLMIQLRTAKSIVVRPFTLKDVPLP